MKRVFFAHSAQTDIEDVRNNSKRLKEMLERLHDDTYKIVAGRQDFQSNFRGDWDIWQKAAWIYQSLANRTYQLPKIVCSHSMNGKRAMCCCR